MSSDTLTLLAACLASLMAGFVDAVVGGGGLIQLPALLVLFPDSSFAHISSVNKAASCAGTFLALVRYMGHIKIPARRALPGCLLAFLASGAGALVASHAPTSFMRGFACAASVGVVAFTLSRKTSLSSARVASLLPQAVAVSGLAVLVGFYDGFFGPGTGSFFVFGLVVLLGLDFLSASAEAKALNLSTNLAAIVVFAWVGFFDPKLFVPLAFFNMAGSFVGSHLALKKGASFVRLMFIGVVSVLILKLGYELARDLVS